MFWYSLLFIEENNLPNFLMSLGRFKEDLSDRKTDKYRVPNVCSAEEFYRDSESRKVVPAFPGTKIGAFVWRALAEKDTTPESRTNSYQRFIDVIDRLVPIEGNFCLDVACMPDIDQKKLPTGFGHRILRVVDGGGKATYCFAYEAADDNSNWAEVAFYTDGATGKVELRRPRLVIIKDPPQTFYEPREPITAPWLPIHAHQISAVLEEAVPR